MGFFFFLVLANGALLLGLVIKNCEMLFDETVFLKCLNIVQIKVA